jgi:hypothetical protein
MTADDLCAVLLAHADSLDIRITRHAGNPDVLAQIARSTPTALRALVAEVRKP